jgi:double-strand break repair protein MRE11
MAIRHVALLQIQGKEFQLTPLPLRTVRPFIIEDIVLSEVADEAGLDLNDQMAINKFLKGKVSLFSDFTNSDCWLIDHLSPGQRSH